LAVVVISWRKRSAPMTAASWGQIDGGHAALAQLAVDPVAVAQEIAEGGIKHR